MELLYIELTTFKSTCNKKKLAHEQTILLGKSIDNRYIIHSVLLFYNKNSSSLEHQARFVPPAVINQYKAIEFLEVQNWCTISLFNTRFLICSVNFTLKPKECFFHHHLPIPQAEIKLKFYCYKYQWQQQQRQQKRVEPRSNKSERKLKSCQCTSALQGNKSAPM